MMTLDQVKDAVCQEYGNRDFLQFKIKCLKQANPLHDMIPMLDEVARRYAKEAVNDFHKELINELKTNPN